MEERRSVHVRKTGFGLHSQRVACCELQSLVSFAPEVSPITDSVASISAADASRSSWRLTIRRLAIVGLIGAATLTMQQRIGDVTICQPLNRAKAETLHRSILANQPPPGLTWDSLGANGTNIRLGAVLIAEGVHRAVGLSIPRSYLLLDTLYLALGLLLFVRYLSGWFRDEYVLIGTLYFIGVLPLTFFLQSYHPWDRLALVFWLLLLLALRAERMLIFAVLLPLSVAIKYDSVLLPGLYFLANVKPSSWRRTTLITAGLFVLSFGTYLGLQLLRTGGFASKSIVEQIGLNFAELRVLLIWYPPLLAFGVPLLLAVIGFRHANRFIQASALFGVLLFIPLFLQSMFAEFRAQVPMLVLILPCALRGLEVLLAPAAVNVEATGTT